MRFAPMTSTMIVVMVMVMVSQVAGHGMMLDPVQRSSMWRDGVHYPNAAKNYDDNQLFCGGASTQWNKYGGKCGICGDNYGDPHPRANEAGGVYATGIIVKTYSKGDVIDVAVKITANHLGYFIFKLCPNNDVTTEATQECLDDHVLKVVGDDGKDQGDKYFIDSKINTKHVKLRLPADVTCTQCVLQWTYNAGNSWGCEINDPSDCCVGCGPQENFVNCADIAITDDGSNPITAAPTTTTEKPKATDSPATTRGPATQTPQPTPQPTTAKPTTAKPTTAQATTTTKKPEATESPNQTGCVAVYPYSAAPGMTGWCNTMCSLNYCPATHCKCS